MAILIDCEMPTKCADCGFFNADGYSENCLLYSHGIPTRYGLDGNQKPEWCELKEVPTGKWINHNITWECSECHYEVQAWNNTPYCPNCSTKMVEEQQGEKKL